MRDSLKTLQTKFKALGLYQLIGGALGILVTLWMIDFSSASILVVLIVLFSTCLFGYSIYCGWLLLKYQKNGLMHSKINQLLQAVHLYAFGYAFEYVSGGYFSIGIDLTESFLLKLNAGTSTWQLNINSNDPTLIVSVNVVALFLISYIDKLQNRVEALEAGEKVADLVEIQEAQPLT